MATKTSNLAKRKIAWGESTHGAITDGKINGRVVASIFKHYEAKLVVYRKRYGSQRRVTFWLKSRNLRKLKEIAEKAYALL